MRYAILGDIHGNLEALESVLVKLEQEKPDCHICIGDIVGYGADPAACIKKIKELKRCIITGGNHDYATADIVNTDFFNHYARESIRWTKQQLKPDDIEFLRQLKLVQQINTITVVHSSPYRPEIFDYLQTSHDVHLGFDNLKSSLCFIGHSHVPGAFSSENGIISYITEPCIQVKHNAKLIVNVGSIGQPRDSNPAATYAIYDEAANEVCIKRVEYDVQKAADKIIQARLPNILAERLKCGR